MKTLEEWNVDRRKAIKAANTYPRPNGIGCPVCGQELQDDDSIILMSSPPRRNVSCQNCHFKGYRIT